MQTSITGTPAAVLAKNATWVAVPFGNVRASSHREFAENRNGREPELSRQELGPPQQCRSIEGLNIAIPHLNGQRQWLSEPPPVCLASSALGGKFWTYGLCCTSEVKESSCGAKLRTF
jgi:hypothetical protein